jgi:hypothetical protein
VFRVFENMVPRGIFGLNRKEKEDRWKLHYEELHNF